MLYLFRTTLTIVLVVVYVVSTMVLAAADTLSGTVQNVDPRQGRLTIKAGEERVIELRAPAELLTDLQSGDAVEVTRSGQRATFIRRQEGVQQPEFGGALRLPPPDQVPQSQ